MWPFWPAAGDNWTAVTRQRDERGCKRGGEHLERFLRRKEKKVEKAGTECWVPCARTCLGSADGRACLRAAERCSGEGILHKCLTPKWVWRQADRSTVIMGRGRAPGLRREAGDPRGVLSEGWKSSVTRRCHQLGREDPVKLLENNAGGTARRWAASRQHNEPDGHPQGQVRKGSAPSFVRT